MHIEDGYMYSYGERLYLIRAQHKLTMKDMAKSVGVAPSTWSKYENDTSFPSGRTIVNLCTIYHVNREWLDCGEGEVYTDGYQPGDPLGEKIDFDARKEELIRDIRLAAFTGKGEKYSEMLQELAEIY